MEALSQAIKVAGGVAKLASSLGLRANVVGNWKMRRQVPADQCPAVERATGVRCEQLRPEIVWTRDTSGQVTGYHVPLPPEQADAA